MYAIDTGGTLDILPAVLLLYGQPSKLRRDQWN